MEINKAALYQRLSQEQNLIRVVSRDEKYDKIIVIDPWRVANPNIMVAANVLLAVAGGFLVAALFGLYNSALAGIIIANIVIVAMVLRGGAPSASGLQYWNGYVVLGDTKEIEALDQEIKKLPVRQE